MKRHLSAAFCHNTLLAVLAFAGSSALADTVVVPSTLAARDAVLGAGPLGAANYRSQHVYGAVHFPPGVALVIRELRFRPDYYYGFAFTSTVASIQINLSTTRQNPNLLSPSYANNIGPDDTVVFSGGITLSSSFTGPANGPKDFDIVFPLATPFIYDPALGSLLVDIRNFSGGANVSPLSGESAPNDAASRVGGSISNPSGGADTGVEALQVVYTSTNAPPRPVFVTRGPYLQLGSKSNILVRWRTNLPTNSVVRFGLQENALTWTNTDPVFTTEHIMTVTNLSPDTKYFYGVSADGTNLAQGASYFFLTAPAQPKPTRIWALGDSGSANQPRFYAAQDPIAVRNAYYQHAATRYTDVWLMLGDNAYMSGTDEEYQTNVFGVYPTMLRQTPLWPTIGNHEVDGSGDASAYLAMFSVPQNGEAGGVPSGSKHYYSWDYSNIHFVCLDSEVSSRDPGASMLTWLEQDLAAATNDWLVVFWHSPPYSYGSHDSDNLGDSGGKLVQMRQNVVPILENHGVDLVMCGHSHGYERSMLIDGHYGYGNSFVATMAKDSGSGRVDDTGPYLKAGPAPTPHEGTVYIVCGSSGWVTGPALSVPAGAYLHHPASYIGLAQLGSMVLDVSSNRLDAKFLRENGNIDDYFTMIKGRGPDPLRFATFRVQNGTITAQFKTIAGRTYRVERSPSLSAPNWQAAGENVTATGATSRWTASAPAGPEFYYRVVQVSP